MPPPRQSEGDIVKVIADFAKQVADLSGNVGELTAQVREQIHISNNTQLMVQGLGERLRRLEDKENRREGASGLLHTVLRSPALGWLFMAAVTIWAFMTGRVEP